MSRITGYVVVIGNLVRAIGPFRTMREAEAYASRFDITSENYRPGVWAGYSVTIVNLEEAEM